MMTPDQRFRLALINMAQGAQRQADALRAWAVRGDHEEQARAYERVSVLLCNEADALRAQDPPRRVDTDQSPPHDRVTR